jgi:hypothetical protein
MLKNMASCRGFLRDRPPSYPRSQIPPQKIASPENRGRSARSRCLGGNHGVASAIAPTLTGGWKPG